VLSRHLGRVGACDGDVDERPVVKRLMGDGNGDGGGYGGSLG
jgi:hypothetical protein